METSFHVVLFETRLYYSAAQIETVRHDSSAENTTSLVKTVDHILVYHIRSSLVSKWDERIGDVPFRLNNSR